MMTGKNLTGTGTATAHSGSGYLLSAGICGGSDAATIVVRTGGSGGEIICKLGVAAATSDSRTFLSGKPYSDLHVTATGTAMVWELEVG